MTIRPIRIFADSGHHYDFVPLDEERLNDPRYQELQMQFWADDQPWERHPEYRWIAFRKGVHDGDSGRVCGYWIAIESNLGAASRGFVYEPEQAVNHYAACDQPLPTPYAFVSESALAGVQGPVFVRIPVRDAYGDVIDELPLPPIVWQRPAADEPIKVDLVVDFGNTRSVALLLENPGDAKPFQETCQPVRFIRRGTSFSGFASEREQGDPCSIVDSWIILHETIFSQFWPPSDDIDPIVVPKTAIVKQGVFVKKTVKKVVAHAKYLPQMFVEMAPVIIGGGNGKDSAREILNNVKLELDAQVFLSSPKRYAWDGDPVGIEGKQYWHVVLNRWNVHNAGEFQVQLPPLQGPVLLFLDSDGRFDWDLESPPNERTDYRCRPQATGPATHPRRDSLAWAALAILEAAYRQIGSQEYRRMMGSPFVPRRLGSVLVTFPSGWTSEELERYREQWQKAIYVFTLAHLARREDCPRLYFDLDEAVASQLPIVFSEVRALGNRGENWVELVGRGQGEHSRVRVMNIDIGGGTSDIAVVEYQDTLAGPMVNMQSTLLFRNTSSIAGDELVKRVIEKVLLPTLRDGLSDEEERGRFPKLFRNTPPEWKNAETAYRQQLSRIVRLVFIPIVNHWLSGLSGGMADSPASWSKPLSEIRDGMGQQLVQKAALDDLNRIGRRFVIGGEGPAADLLPWDSPIPCDIQKLRTCIDEVFAPLFVTLGCLEAAFDCDLIFVSGKPSELPEIRSMLLKHLTSLPQRIVFAHQYAVGEWYPFGAADGRIYDAKTPTVVGAALAQAMRGTKQLGNWMLTSRTELMLNDNYWGLMSGPSGVAFCQDVFLRPGVEEAVCDVLVGAQIGRMRYLCRHISPEPVYKLRWRNRRQSTVAQVRIKLRRKKTDSLSEQLELAEVLTGEDGQGLPIHRDDLELMLCTLCEEAFWMDNPSFEIG